MIGAPAQSGCTLRAVLADMKMWTPVPWDSMKLARVVVAGRDISVGSQPVATQVLKSSMASDFTSARMWSLCDLLRIKVKHGWDEDCNKPGCMCMMYHGH